MNIPALCRLSVWLCVLVPFGFAGCGERGRQAVPEGISPLPGAQTYSPAPSLRWKPVEGAADYTVQIARNAAFTEGLMNDRTPIPRYVAPQGLEPGTYYWRVAAVRGSGVGAFSPAASFSILEHRKVFPIPPDADLEMMRKIVADASAQAPAKVVFAPGAEYRIAPEAFAFSLRDVSDLELDGNGATLIITRPTAAFLDLSRCGRVTVRNFTIDFDPVPFAVGTVQAVNEKSGTFTVTSDPGMPEFDAPHMLDHWSMGVTLDGRTPGRMKTGSFLVVDTDQSRSSRTGAGFVIALKNPQVAASFAPGDKYVQFARSNGGRSLVVGDHAHEAAFIGITTYAISAGHYVLHYSDDAKVLGCRELIRPGRWFGGNADGVHVRSSGMGPWIEGCTIEGIGDDGIAIYGKGIRILEKPTETSLRLDAEFFTLKPGTEFLVFDPSTGYPIAEKLTVRTVTEVPKDAVRPRHWLVEFSPGFPQAVAAGEKEPWQNSQVFDRSAQHQDFMIRRNIIRQVRRYGAIIRAVNGAVEENEITQSSDSAITLHNEPRFWRNGLQSENILIQNNVIRDCNFTQSSKNRGSITVLMRKMQFDGQTWTDVPSSWKGHRNIVIRNNAISQWQQRGIMVQSASDVVVSGNRITEPLPNTLGTSGQYGIYLADVADAVVEGNAVELSPTVTEAIAVVHGEDVALRENSTSPAR